jgi:hypothetical protein
MLKQHSVKHHKVQHLMLNQLIVAHDIRTDATAEKHTILRLSDYNL